MKSQLSLSLSHDLRYSSALFLEHAGTVEPVNMVFALAQQRGFSLVYIAGGGGTGKTHLGVYLVGKLRREQARDARFVSSEDLRSWYSEELPAHPFQGGEVLIIDDADRVLEGPHGEANVGIFVDIVERLANADGMIVLLGASQPEKLRCSSHAKSRIEAGLHILLGDPKEEDLDTLLDRMTKQRGLQLKESKRSYLLRRVTRTIPALVECLNRLEEGGDWSDSSTTFTALSGGGADQ